MKLPQFMFYVNLFSMKRVLMKHGIKKLEFKKLDLNKLGLKKLQLKISTDIILRTDPNFFEILINSLCEKLATSEFYSAHISSAPFLTHSVYISSSTALVNGNHLNSPFNLLPDAPTPLPPY